MITGWTALAWISVGLLAPVAGLGMTVLISGLPSPRSPGSPASAGAAPAAGRPQRQGAAVALAAPAATAASSSPTRSGRQPVAAIAAHGLFVVATLLLVLLAAIGA
jgi:hypothetical protein